MTSMNTNELKPRGERAARITAKLRNMGAPMSRLWHNGRNDSLPFVVFAALLALTQYHRHTLTPDQYDTEVYGLYGWIVVPSIIVFFIALIKASKAFILGTTAGTAVVGMWMIHATVMGPNIKTIILGLFMTCVMGIPYWLTRVNKEIERSKALAKHEKAVEVKAEGPFDRISWLKGGEWLTDPMHTATGFSRLLLLPDGTPANNFVELRAEGMANVVKASNPDDVELIVRSADRVEVVVHKSNILTESRPWPLREASRTNILDPIPVGTFRTGETAILRLQERHVLIGGVPGSGKSGLAQMLMAVAALDPRCDVWAFDGKKVELYPWRDSCAVYVGDRQAEALAALRKLQTEMDRRYEIMREMGKRKFTDTGGRVGPVLVVIDELARYLRDGTNTEIQEFRNRLGDVLDRGRACGIMVVALTQQPGSKMLEDLRRSFTYRIALRVVEKTHSSMILGASYPDASKLNEDLPGLAYLGATGTPRQMRAFFIEDDEIDALVAKAFKPLDPIEDLEDEIVVEDYPEIEAGPTVKTMWVANEQDGDDVLFPDGARVPAHRIALWRAVTTEPKSASALARELGKDQNPIRETLKRWLSEGYIEVERNPAPVGDLYFKEA